jgi:hypothetical protein
MIEATGACARACTHESGHPMSAVGDKAEIARTVRASLTDPNRTCGRGGPSREGVRIAIGAHQEMRFSCMLPDDRKPCGSLVYDR